MKRTRVAGHAITFSLFAVGCLLAQQPRVSNAHAGPQALARERWQTSGRMQGTADLRRQAIQQKLKARTLRSRFTSSIALGGGWTSLGPLPLPSDASGIGIQDYGWVSGRATAVAIDPNDLTGNTVFVGGAYGGIWKSSNAGALSFNSASVSWTPMTDNQMTLAIGAIAVQPQNSAPDVTKSVVLAGTGETNSAADSYYGLGILRSADGGAHWNLITQDSSGAHSFAGLGFSQIAFSLGNPSLVVAAAASASQGIVEGLENPLTANRGLYYSTDAGLTWAAANLSDAGIGVGPASVTSVTYNAAANTFYAAVRFHGFYSSSDGANWTRLSSQPGLGLTAAACPSQSLQPSSCHIYRGQIALVPNRSGASGLGEMYVWYVDANDMDQGIWQSSNGGASWTQINDSGITNCGDFFGGCGTVQGTYNLALAAVPSGTATDLYAGATNLYKCTITAAAPTCGGTGANTFLNLTHVYGCSDIGKVHPDQHAMDFLVANGTA
jgi:large repetitive protein